MKLARLTEVDVVADKPHHDVVLDDGQPSQSLWRSVELTGLQNGQQAAVVEVVDEVVGRIAPVPRRVDRRVLRDVVVHRTRSGRGGHVGVSLRVREGSACRDRHHHATGDVEACVTATGQLEPVAVEELVRFGERERHSIAGAGNGRNRLREPEGRQSEVVCLGSVCCCCQRAVESDAADEVGAGGRCRRQPGDGDDLAFLDEDCRRRL